jgi:hypothetical protein
MQITGPSGALIPALSRLADAQADPPMAGATITNLPITHTTAWSRCPQTKALPAMQAAPGEQIPITGSSCRPHRAASSRLRHARPHADHPDLRDRRCA